MKRKHFTEIVDHIWKFREYLQYLPDFESPFYGGLKSKMSRQSPESVDAMQKIWPDFICGEINSKKDFKSFYRCELGKLGESVK